MHLSSHTPILPPATSSRRLTPTPWLRHAALVVPVAACTVAALLLALHALPLGGGARIVYAVAVAVNVGLLALSSWSGILGAAVAVWQRFGGHIGGPVLRAPTGQARTAILLPVYEEDAVRVLSAASVMADSVAAEHAGVIDVFVLSDTRSATGAGAEQDAYSRLLAIRSPSRPAIHYRRRADNTGRKAGNIAEFCGRWGADYDFMVVLDADSLMTGAAIARLIGAMEANPNAGLIQTMCYPIGGGTLFARMQQFGARLYGPLLARGVAFWTGPRGSYWGHNAILRVAAYAAHCGLPELAGAAPLGGEILCHDTVEAALLLRAGWDAWLLPDGPQGQHDGSWEQTPSNLIDHLNRDRRWCQGNLQHGAVLRADGLKAASYLHLGQGIAHYLSAPLFLAWLAMSTLAGPHSAPQADRALLWLTLVLMLAPRVLALGAALASTSLSAGFGGRTRLLLGAVLDQLFGLLAGPVMMVFYLQFVATTLAGRVVRWDAQPRDDRGVGWGEAVRRFGPALATAGVVAAAAAVVAPYAAGAMLPGLVLGIPLAVWTSGGWLSRLAVRAGLFGTPEERRPSAAVRAADAAYAQLLVTERRAKRPPLPDDNGLPVIVQQLRARSARTFSRNMTSARAG